MTFDEITILLERANAYARHQTNDKYERSLIRDDRFAYLVEQATIKHCANFLREQSRGTISNAASVVSSCADALDRLAKSKETV